MKFLRVLIALLLFEVVFPRSALAHDPFETTTKVVPRHDRIEVEMIMARATAQALYGKARVPMAGQPWKDSPRLDELYELSSDGKALTLASSTLVEGVEGDAAGDFVFDLEFVAPPPIKKLQMRSLYLEKLEQGYTGIVQVVTANAGLIDVKVLHSSDPLLSVSLPERDLAPKSEQERSGSSEARAKSFGLFFVVGMEHVVFGYDHLLFLLGVLIACFGFRQAVGILTTFTLAHSVTLGLAVFGFVPLASDFVEPFIALSIAAGAFFGPALQARRLLFPVTFAFGLVHGLGFASGLQSLADEGNVRLLNLVAFNLGVEVGQIGAALLLLPALAWCRRSDRGEDALDWTARTVGALGVMIFMWRVIQLV